MSFIALRLRSEGNTMKNGESAVCFLLHDNAPAHRSVSVKDFLANNIVTTLEHLPYSPDLPKAGRESMGDVFPWLKSALKGRRFYDAPDVIMNRKEELKSLHKMASTNVSITCTATVRSVWLHEGTILKDMWLKRFTVLYFPDVMWFWEHSEATMYNRILEPRMITEYLTDERQSTTICISVYKCNKRTGHKAFKAAAADDHDDEGGNDDSENNVISTLWSVQFMKLFKMSFSLSSCYFILLRLKYRTQQNILE